ncbi:helix-turn-helix transcriptional regulator [Cytophagaceae bacterium YF14B1]|uniref:Helix-turn-helix transcriptional regulator n=1 Tax=Xanthocytophaga flava TaxID=3048013 RepID=A0AAE3U4E6_9BACT|nr:helix-turn-helix transcriptional regulator [Xanthocytophaga flavus]MDJ1479714.1 helix-turn-helix transcriptional regulator [Xanthocytophaga flavus]
MEVRSIDTFYKELAESTQKGRYTLLPEGITKETGHFNVFNIANFFTKFKETGEALMPYNRRAYYKISFIKGHNRAEYADKVIDIQKSALLFATPKIPYHWLPQDLEQSGYFCIFTEDFLIKSKSGVAIDELPIFKPGGYPVFELSDEDMNRIEAIFLKMNEELYSDYIYKYDLLRNYVLELIHFGQKLQPAMALTTKHNGTARVSSLFTELLERQFPIESPKQTIGLRTAKDYADRLSVHVNYLNRALKEQTGKTTTEIITNRITQEAKVLLRQTKWNISEIAYCLGFEEVAHFSNFFRKQTSFSPVNFRN